MDEWELEAYQSDDLMIYNLTLPAWGIQLPVVQTPNKRLWWPVRAICEDVFGLASNGQITRLRKDEETGPLLSELHIKGRKGSRLTTVLEFQGLSRWLTILQTNSMTKPDVKEKVKRFKYVSWKVNQKILFNPSQEQIQEFQQIADTFEKEGSTEEERLTIEGLNRSAALQERRLANVEQVLFGPNYVNEREEDEDGAGILNIPFSVPHGGRFVLRLRQVPWSAPEIVGIFPVE
jgi:hypothetical protein